MKLPFIISLTLSLVPCAAYAQLETWRVNAGADAGPLAQIDLPGPNGRNRVVLVAFEYARKCDPILSFGEFAGRKPGAPITQSRLGSSKIGVVVDGEFFTWHAAQTIYDNGYEAGFGVTNELFRRLSDQVRSFVFVTPSGERMAVPTTNFNPAVREALELCAKRVR